MNIPAQLRWEAIQRVKNRCEYCHLSQKGQEETFHVDHIVPVLLGGETVSENLALACVSCSLLKGAHRLGRDPLTGEEISIFHPRFEVWSEHFSGKVNRVVGKSPTGRATVELLKMNRLLAV